MMEVRSHYSELSAHVTARNTNFRYARSWEAAAYQTVTVVFSEILLN